MTMHIRKIGIENIRCFKGIEIDLTSEMSRRRWCLILGDNGVGKTTVLRSIGMGLCDSTSAAALQRELYGEWLRQGAERGRIEIELSDSTRDGKHYRITTTFERTPSGYLSIQQETEPKRFPWDEIFVCGYGAARRSFGTKDYDEYATLDAMYTLFNYDAPLQTPELVLRRIGFKKAKLSDDVLRDLEVILTLPDGCISLTRTGLAVGGPWGKLVPLGALGDGYQATLAWIVDLLGWALLYDEKMIRTKIQGVVLVDELEQHLHPKWQRLLIGLLAKQFPKLQFIGTSHSALCASGMADLPEQQSRQILLRLESDGAVEAENLGVPTGLRADQILTSSAFGLETTRDPRSAEKLDRFAELFQKEARSSSEQREFASLRKWLRTHAPEAAESARDRQVQKELRDLLARVSASIGQRGRRHR